MVQPKTPPISIRVPAPLLAAIDAMAERKGMKRHAAILLALAMGEAANRGITPESTQRLAETIAKFPPRSEPTTGVEVMALVRQKQASTFHPHPKPGKAKR